MNIGKDFNNYATKHMGINSMTLNNYTSSITPYIMEERELNVTQIDVFSRLMMERVIFLGTAIDDRVSNIIEAQLLYLESIDKEAPIQIYVNSPGGSVYAGLGIYDTMQYIKPEISTICTGLAASMAAVLLCAGAKGKRFALPHSRIMIHQPLGGARGQASDIQIQAAEIQDLKQQLTQIYVDHTSEGITYDQYEKSMDRDNYLSPGLALEMGLIDKIILPKGKSEIKEEE